MNTTTIFCQRQKKLRLLNSGVYSSWNTSFPFRLDIYGLLLTIVKRVNKFLNLDHRPRKRSCISIESSNTLKRTENGLFSSVTDLFWQTSGLNYPALTLVHENHYFALPLWQIYQVLHNNLEFQYWVNLSCKRHSRWVSVRWIILHSKRKWS